MGEAERLERERETLQDDYENRKAGMLRLAIIMGAVVVLSLLAMFVGVIALYSAIDSLKITQTTFHNCTISLLHQAILGTHNIHTEACQVGGAP